MPYANHKKSTSANELVFAHDADTLRQLATDVLSCASKAGASAAHVSISEGFGQSVSVRHGDVENIEYNRGKGIGLSLYLGQKMGYASTADFSQKAIKQTVEAALAIARHTSSDKAAGLPEGDLLVRGNTPDLQLYHPWQLSTEKAIELAKQSEAAAFTHDSQINNSEGAGVSSHQSHFISANSLGFMDGFPSSSHQIYCTAIAEADGGKQRDSWYSANRNSRLLESAQAVGQKAAARCVARLDARKIETGVWPVLFEAPLAVGLLGSLARATSGSMLYRQTSFLSNCLGKQLFPEFIQLDEKPHLPGEYASTPFDGEGVATNARQVVRDGVLQGYFLDVYSARKLGLSTTANSGGSHNLLLQSGDDDLPGLFKRMQRGLFVTELLGQGVNYVNGDYSRGAVGFWIEDGEIAYPVEEITIAGNLADMYADIVAVGNDVDRRGGKQCGSILIEKMTLAGN